MERWQRSDFVSAIAEKFTGFEAENADTDRLMS